MKKFIALILMALSCVMCFTACSTDDTKDEGTTSTVLWEETLLDDWYLEDDEIVFRLIINTKKDVYEKVTYSINNGKEVEVSVLTGKVSNDKHDLGGKYYVDTGTEIIDSKELDVGAYVIIFYAYDADGECIQVNDKPIVFQIKAEE